MTKKTNAKATFFLCRFDLISKIHCHPVRKILYSLLLEIYSRFPFFTNLSNSLKIWFIEHLTYADLFSGSNRSRWNCNVFFSTSENSYMPERFFKNQINEDIWACKELKNTSINCELSRDETDVLINNIPAGDI